MRRSTIWPVFEAAVAQPHVWSNRSLPFQRAVRLCRYIVRAIPGSPNGRDGFRFSTAMVLGSITVRFSSTHPEVARVRIRHISIRPALSSSNPWVDDIITTTASRRLRGLRFQRWLELRPAIRYHSYRPFPQGTQNQVRITVMLIRVPNASDSTGSWFVASYRRP
jgi:hypothetical protein